MSLLLDCNNLSQLQNIPFAPSVCGKLYLNKMALFLFPQIDQAAVTVDTDATTGAKCITAVALSTGTAVTAQYDREKAKLTWKKEGESPFYNVTLTIPVDGLSKEIRQATSVLCNSCNIQAVVQDTKCNEFYLGADLNSDDDLVITFNNSGKVSDHSVDLGGGDDTTNVITITWKQCGEPLFADQGVCESLAA